MPRNMVVSLPTAAFDALAELAAGELRPVRDQALLLILLGLHQRGLLGQGSPVRSVEDLQRAITGQALPDPRTEGPHAGR